LIILALSIGMCCFSVQCERYICAVNSNEAVTISCLLDVTDSRAAFPGYMPSEGSTLASRSLWDRGNLRASAEFGKTDV